jgi:hypothetical protein
MKIVEQKVSAGQQGIFDLQEFLARPLFAHLATISAEGARESPVWFHWDGEAIWIIGGESFPRNIERDGRCALGIVDWNLASGLLHHVGLRGMAEVVAWREEMALAIFEKYFGQDRTQWDRRFDDVLGGGHELQLVKFMPETVVMRDQSYKPTPWASQRS